MDVVDILAAVSGWRFPLNDEKVCQREFALVLELGGATFEREVKLSPGDVIDFLLSNGIGVELKLRGQRKAHIFKQLRRYAKHEQVVCLILVTNVSMGLPPEIEGKPVYYASLGRAWI